MLSWGGDRDGWSMMNSEVRNLWVLNRRKPNSGWLTNKDLLAHVTGKSRGSAGSRYS